SSYENQRAITNAVLRFRFVDRRLVPLEPIRGWGASVGPLGLAGLDREGNFDLIVGGRTNPGRYPEPVSSKLFRFKNGTFVEDEKNSRLFAKIGLVSSAA